LEGYSLDTHSTSSSFTGYDDFGHATFVTDRSSMGELLYLLKSHGDLSAATLIGDAAANFVECREMDADLIIPVPPSNLSRRVQPVLAVANVISQRLGIPVCSSCVTKVKNTGQVKDSSDPWVREKMLEGAFLVDKRRVEGKRVLLFDDLYRSGATVGSIARELVGNGVGTLYLLVLTQTRKNV
jgi:predicted amidophosphoribosyltransferase